MRENERLIGTIASNIDYTRTTIESIQESLQTTKLTLDAGEQNAIESVKVLHESNRTLVICLLIAFAFIALIVYLVVRSI